MRRPSAFLFCFLAAFSAPAARAQEAILVEAEWLEIHGGFQLQEANGPTTFLTAGPRGQVAPAAGAIQIPTAGAWRLWVRSRSWPEDRPGMRNFAVSLAGARSLTVFGNHRTTVNEWWAWEDGGVFQLDAGPILVVLGESNTAQAQCDAILLTRGDGAPSGLPAKLNASPARTATLQVNSVDSAATHVPAPVYGISREPAVTIENNLLRLAFHTGRSGSAATVTLAATLRQRGEWRPVPGQPETESYRVVTRPPGSDPRIVATGTQFPSWDVSLAPESELSAGGKSFRSRIGPATAPWLAGRCYALRPSGVRKIDAQTAELDFPAIDAGHLTAAWHLRNDSPSAEVTLRLTGSAPQQVSLGYHGLMAALPADLDFLLLPFMFQGRRFPAQPVTMLNALMPAPLSLVTRQGISYAVVAEPSQIPFEWLNSKDSRYAFGIRNEQGEAQPLVYTPVLGQTGSITGGKAPVTGRFRVWIQPGNWYDAYRAIVTGPFQLRDYRRPTYASLSDTALNLLDLMSNDTANGWNAEAKGPWNIESLNTVSHSSPLLYMSYYLLTGNETFYRRYALPTLEFLASRPSQHHAVRRNMGRYYPEHRPLGGPVPFYGATVYSGAYEMTHGQAPAFGEFALGPGGAAATRGGTHPDPFEDSLALYRLTGERRWLDQAMEGADRYIAEHIKRLPERDLGSRPFLNTTFVPNWEGLLHMFEATQERRFLDASAEGARWLLTTLWVHPVVPRKNVTIHPGGIYDHSRTIWWLGSARYRLGIYDREAGTTEFPRIEVPPTPLPERQVPAWQVSNVGLGLEQPFTYPRQYNHANITMSIWAPNLLRLAHLTGDTLFRTAARNATIGRFGNYPGYYIDNWTDVYQRPNYPVEGPDVTTIYHHHIPVFAAYVLDYLFTDAEVRSSGAVTFPWVRQNGYVWFDSRLRGHASGKVYGEEAWPWLHRTAAAVDTPNVDVVLAHGRNAFHVILLNQTPERQRVNLKLDAAVLRRPLERATLRARFDNHPSTPVEVRNGQASLELQPMGIAALTLEGVNIDVPTHRTAPPEHLALPARPAVERKAVAGTGLEARGMLIAAPPFAARDLFVYVAAGIDQCSGATLRYRVEGRPEQTVPVDRYPCEFSVRIDDPKAAVTWSVEALRR